MGDKLAWHFGKGEQDHFIAVFVILLLAMEGGSQ